MDKKEELLERLVNEFAAYNRLTAVRIAKENLFSWGKSDEEIVKEMKSSSERILNGDIQPMKIFLLIHRKQQL